MPINRGNDEASKIDFYLEALIWRELVYTVESLDSLRVVLIRDLLISRHSSFFGIFGVY